MKQNGIEEVNLYNANTATATNHITGRIYAMEDCLLVWSIPYSTGWKAYVDGVQKQVYRTDYMYLAVPLSEGEHNIELRYETPLMKVGKWISIASWIFFGGSVLWNKRKR